MPKSGNKYTKSFVKNDIYDQLSGNKSKLKNECNKLYYAFLDNKDKSYHEFMNSVFEKVNPSITDKNERLNYINEHIDIMKKIYSVRKAVVMSIIYNLSIYLVTNNNEKVEDCRNKLNNYFKSEEELKKVKESRNEKYNESHSILISNMKETIDKVLNDEVIENDEKSKFNQRVKHNYKEIDKDVYLDFIIKRFKLESVTEKELLELNETIDFFITNLNNNINILLNLDPLEDDVLPELTRYKLNGEDALTDTFKSKMTRYYNWKLKSLRRLLDAYEEYKCLLIELNSSDDLTFKNELNSYSRLLLLNEEDFIINFYNNVKKINEIDKSYVSGLIAPDSIVEDYKRSFIKKLSNKNN